MQAPLKMEIVGDVLAISWPDGKEDYLPHAYLRAHSPSAETRGERDIFGQQYGGHTKRDFSSVRLSGWRNAGNYAAQLIFDDGHNTGLYSWEYLRGLAEKLEE